MCVIRLASRVSHRTWDTLGARWKTVEGKAEYPQRPASWLAFGCGAAKMMRVFFWFQITNSLSWLAPGQSPGRAPPSGPWIAMPGRTRRARMSAATTTAPTARTVTSTRSPWPTQSPSTPRPSWSGTCCAPTRSRLLRAVTERGPHPPTNIPCPPGASPLPQGPPGGTIRCHQAPSLQTETMTSPRPAASWLRRAETLPLRRFRCVLGWMMVIQPPETASHRSTRRPWLLFCEHNVKETCCGAERAAVTSHWKTYACVWFNRILETTSHTVYKTGQLVLFLPLAWEPIGFYWAIKMKKFRRHFHFSNCDTELL
jgi:hypothetical protein